MNAEHIDEALRIEEEESIEMIASGYEWACPRCQELNHEIEVADRVECRHCRKSFPVSDYFHAYE